MKKKLYGLGVSVEVSSEISWYNTAPYNVLTLLRHTADGTLFFYSANELAMGTVTFQNTETMLRVRFLKSCWNEIIQWRKSSCFLRCQRQVPSERLLSYLMKKLCLWELTKDGNISLWVQVSWLFILWILKFFLKFTARDAGSTCNDANDNNVRVSLLWSGSASFKPSQ